MLHGNNAFVTLIKPRRLACLYESSDSSTIVGSHLCTSKEHGCAVAHPPRVATKRHVDHPICQLCLSLERTSGLSDRAQSEEVAIRVTRPTEPTRLSVKCVNPTGQLVKVGAQSLYYPEAHLPSTALCIIACNMHLITLHASSPKNKVQSSFDRVHLIILVAQLSEARTHSTCKAILHTVTSTGTTY